MARDGEVYWKHKNGKEKMIEVTPRFRQFLTNSGERIFVLKSRHKDQYVVITDDRVCGLTVHENVSIGSNYDSTFTKQEVEQRFKITL
jgi:hypothetical protein